MFVHCVEPALLCLFPGKPRGYAFIEYEHKNNMKEAYKRADGKKVEGKRVVVDVERGRTVPNWYVLQACFTVCECSLRVRPWPCSIIYAPSCSVVYTLGLVVHIRDQA